MNQACFESVALCGTDMALCSSCDEASSCVRGAQARIDLLPPHPCTTAARIRLVSFAKHLAGEPQGDAEKVTVSRRGVIRRELTQAESSRVKSLPARIQATARKLLSQGWFELAHRQLDMGRCPTAPGGLGLAMGYLVNGPISRADLVARITERGVKPASAQVEASSVIALLEFGRLAQLRSGQLSLLPSNERHYHAL